MLNLPRILTLLACVAVWVVAIAAWPHLPETIPIHFNLKGEADRWVSGNSPLWFLIPALLTAPNAILVWAIRVAIRSPERVVPLPDVYASLSSRAKDVVASFVVAFTDWLAVLVNALFVLIQVAMAVGARTGKLPSWFQPGFAAFIVLIVGVTVARTQSIKRRMRSWSMPADKPLR